MRPRGEVKRGREGGGTARPQKGWGETPARSGQDSLSSERLQRRRPTEARRRPDKGHLGSDSVADPALLLTLQGSKYRLLLLVTACAEELEVQIVTLGNSLCGGEASLRPHSCGHTSAALLRPHSCGHTSATLRPHSCGHTSAALQATQYNTIQYNTICLKNSKAGLDVTTSQQDER